MGKIFVRERRRVGRGSGQPRFAILAVAGIDLKVYHTHIRKVELEKLAGELEAEIVYLPRGEHAGEDEGGQAGMGRRRRHGQAANEA